MAHKNRKKGVAIQALVIANATVDETYHVARLPASGESLTGQLRAHDVGGKGANVATVLSRCEIATKLVAVVGNDVRGNFVKSELQQESMELDLVQSTRCSTDISLINVDDTGENTIVTTVEAAHNLEPSRACGALDELQANGLLVLQGNLTESLTKLLISKARQRGVRVVFNPSPLCPWMASVVPTVDTVFMNAVEGLAITGRYGEAAVIAVLDTGPAQVVLTRGESSALLGTRSNDTGLPDQYTVDSVPSIHTQVVDATGAGDTYLAVALASAARRGCPLDVVALTHAASAAAQTVSFHGTRGAFPTSATLKRILTS